MKYLKQIPKGWNEVKVKDYIRIIDSLDDNSTIDELLEEAFFVFTGIPIYETKIKFDESNAIGDRLKFMHDEINETNLTLNLKSVKELNYQDFMTFQLLRKPEKLWHNLIPLLKIFSREPLDEDNLTMQEAMNGFFLLCRDMKPQLLRLQNSFRWLQVKIQIKTLFNKIFSKLKMNFKINGVG